jgi:hypothetical protein
VSWLNLLTPSAAILALFLGIALVIQSIRHGRQIKRIEQQISTAGLASYDPTIDRLKELSGLSEQRGSTAPATAAVARARRTPGTPRDRRPLIIAGIVIAVLVVAGIAWALLARSGSSSAASTTTHAQTHTASSTHPATTTTPTSTQASSVCSGVAPFGSPSSVTVTVLNGSGIAGAARDVVSPKLSGVGFNIGAVSNAPTTGNPTTSIQYVAKADIPAACSIATTLGVPQANVTALTVIPTAQAGTSGVVVVVGKDTAH